MQQYIVYKYRFFIKNKLSQSDVAILICNKFLNLHYTFL